MKLTRKNITFAVLGVAALFAAAAVCGHPVIPAEYFAGLGMLPFAMSGETDVLKQIAQLTDTAKAAKEAMEKVKKSHEELDGRINKIGEELKAGQTDAVTKAAYQEAVAKVENAEKKLDDLTKEVTELAQKASNALGRANKVKSLGQLAAESEVAKSYRGGVAELCEMEGPLFAKAAITSDPASAGALIEAYRVPGVVTDPDTPLTVRDLFTSVSISSNGIEWVREKLFSNNAGAQATEGAPKNESGLTFEKMSSSVETIAHWIPISRQVLADVPQLRGIVDGKLRTGLKIKEDEALLFGDGTNGNLLGLVPQATAYVSTGIPAGATKIDHLRWAFLQSSKSKYPATFAVLSLDDWALIQMMKTTDGAYIFGTPTDGAAPRIWGKRVVESFGMDAGDFLAGSALAATIYDRELVTVRVAEQHADFFIKNMVALLCEERLGFTVERPAAMITGAFPA